MTPSRGFVQSTATNLAAAAAKPTTTAVDVYARVCMIISNQKLYPAAKIDINRDQHDLHFIHVQCHPLERGSHIPV